MDFQSVSQLSLSGLIAPEEPSAPQAPVTQDVELRPEPKRSAAEPAQTAAAERPAEAARHAPEPLTEQEDPADADLAPMLRLYKQVKRRYPEHLLLFQVGDFYEVFFDDARTVSDVLQIRLTSRNKDDVNAIPMCGVPIHAIDNYLPRMLRAGYSCVLVSQVEDARGKKGPVQREVTRIVTPGVRYEGDGLDEKSFNYLASLCPSSRGGAAFTFVDVSTGRLKIAEGELEEEVSDVLRRYRPVELILPTTIDGVAIGKSDHLLKAARTIVEEWDCKVLARPFRRVARDQVGSRLAALLVQGGETSAGGPEDEAAAQARVRPLMSHLTREGTASLLAALDYVEEVSFTSTPKLSDLVIEDQSRTVFIDAATRRNLELTEARIDGNKKSSLFYQIDYSCTAMGSRLLGEWILAPSCDRQEIEGRYDAVAELTDKFETLRSLRETFTSIRDIDRLLSRITGMRANPRDLASLRDSIAVFPRLKEMLTSFGSGVLVALADRFDALDEVSSRLAAALTVDPPMRVSEGGIIRDGYHAEVDRLRGLADHAEDALLQLEQTERERTGISVLKVRFNNVFGYFIEISKNHAARAPAHYERKQTLANAERYTTPELKEFEHQVLSAKARLQELERELFSELRSWVAHQAGRIQDSARVIAELDVLSSLTHLAVKHRFVRPILREDDSSTIIQGRHPVVEQMIGPHNFVGNDTKMDTETRRFALLTGPNMGGKSTYLRQVGLIQLLAQAGSYVPAEYAELGLVDRIFTRIGAADDLARGDSTFMVEMRESASIVRKATRRSLVLIDEIGRGTATNDGLAIATAIAEWLHDVVGCRTIFATHFHELTQIVGEKEGVFCLSVGIVEQGEEISFTHRIEERAAERSFGIEVARLAGLPDSILERAKALLALLDEEGARLTPAAQAGVPGTARTAKAKVPVAGAMVPAAYEIDPVKERLRAVNPDALTPLQALIELAELKLLLRQSR